MSEAPPEIDMRLDPKGGIRLEMKAFGRSRVLNIPEDGNMQARYIEICRDEFPAFVDEARSMEHGPNEVKP